MKTKIIRAGDMITFVMDGKLDYEVQEPLKEDLFKIIDESKTDRTPLKLIFNFEKLEFVGSSGIASFIHTLKEFNAQLPTKPRYCNVKSEFKRMIKAFEESDLFDIYDDEDRARKSFDQ